MENGKWKLIDFSKFSAIKIGPKLKVKIIDEYNYNGEFLIGRATNTLISPSAKNLGILSEKYKFIEYKNGYLIVGGGVKNRVLYNYCKKNNIGGFEFLAHLPGSIGGSVKMNAGVKNEEISNSLVAINGVDKKNFKFNYRNSNIDFPVFEAIFEINRNYDKSLDEYLKKLRSNQPKDPSLGSVFKNPKDNFAGKLIEEVGLKGVKKGDMLISPIHANFFVNLGRGTFEDMIYLINLAKKRVLEKKNIKLNEEIIIIY